MLEPHEGTLQLKYQFNLARNEEVGLIEEQKKDIKKLMF
jgi:hypothetical protein